MFELETFFFNYYFKALSGLIVSNILQMPGMGKKESGSVILPYPFAP